MISLGEALASIASRDHAMTVPDRSRDLPRPSTRPLKRCLPCAMFLGPHPAHLGTWERPNTSPPAFSNGH